MLRKVGKHTEENEYVRLSQTGQGISGAGPNNGESERGVVLPMDECERIAREHLVRRGFKTVVYEPDGNVPPDFLVDGRVAVEVRRLNQHENLGNLNRSLEEVEIPLMQHAESLLKSMGPPGSTGSWFVWFRFRRPVMKWKSLEPILRRELDTIRRGGAPIPSTVRVAKDFYIRLVPASQVHPTFFLLGGCTDQDSGGWIVPELARNLKICIDEKTRKIAHIRKRYPEWWLVLVDYIAFGSQSDIDKLHDDFGIGHRWDKVILVDPTNPERASEV